MRPSHLVPLALSLLGAAGCGARGSLCADVDRRCGPADPPAPDLIGTAEIAYASGLGTYPAPAWTAGTTVNPEHSMPVGDPCASDADCFSGKCLDDGAARYCTRACDDTAPCPEDYTCDGDPKVCGVPGHGWPPAPPPPEVGPTKEEGGCAFQPSRQDTGTACIGVAALLWLAAIRRRNRRA